MSEHLRHPFAPPVFPNESRKTRQAILLHGTLLVTLCITAAYTLATFLGRPIHLPRLVIGLGASVVWAVLLLAVRQGRLAYIALAFTALAWLLVTGLVLFDNGIRSPSIGFYFPLVVISALTLGKRAGFVYTFLSLLSMSAMSLADQHGLLPEAYLSPTSRLTMLAAGLVGTAGITLLGSRELERQAKEQEHRAVTLQEQSVNLAALLEALPDAIFRIRADGRLMDFIPSKEFLPLAPPEDFLEKKIAEILPADLAKQALGYIKRALSEGQTQTFEYALEERFFEARVVPGKDEVIAIVRDITERVRVQAERDELLAAMERGNAQLRAAAEVSKTCSGIFDRQVVIEKAVNIIQKGLDVYYVGLFLLDEKQEYAILQGGSGEAGKQMLKANYALPLRGQSMVAWCIRHNRARIAQQTTLDRVWLQNPYLPHTRSELALPLTSRDQVIGALTVQSARENAFSQSDIVILQTMAEQLAITIDNANLFTELQRELAERKKAEAALRASEEKFQKIFRASPVAISIRDLDGRYLNINDSFTTITGYTQEDVIGKTIDELGLVLDTEEWNREMQRIQREGATQDMAVKVRRKDGEVIHLLINSEITTLDGKERIITSSMDITARKCSEEALKASEEKFSRAFHAFSNAAFILRAADHIYLEVNDAFCRLTGFERSEVHGISALEKSIFGKAGVPESILETLRQCGQVRNVEIEFFTKSGEAGIGLLSADEIVVNGESCYLVLVQDITEQKKAAAEREALIQELSAKNAELERFTYTVSHDLKSPLVTIRGFAGYLEQDIKSGNVERMLGDIQRISKAAERMQRLLDELLELSRIGRLVNPPERVPFGELAREALSLVEGQLTAAQVKVQIDADMPEVYGDRLRLLEALQNLLDNAIKFMGPQKQPHIHIGWKPLPDGEPAFFIKDNGIGIPPQYHEKIFGLFDKLDRNSEGTGVGLALVKRIIEIHNGKIWVESSGSGSGATFYFTLPINKTGGGKDGQ